MRKLRIYKMFVKLISVAILFVHCQHVAGHGMMLEPPNRSSLWRFYDDTPINYDDNANSCGGAQVQNEIFGGKCGVCGDRYDDPHPQKNENTGTYGRGKIVRTYQSGTYVNITINLTSNHIGHFEYSLCILEDSSQPEPGEDCFHRLLLGDGSTRYNVLSTETVISHTIILPQGVTCDRCVLRWHYVAGNSWGVCSNGRGADGCGPQEHFRSCADISIV